MTNAAFIQRMLDDAFATLDYRALAAHLAEGVVFEVTSPGEAGAVNPRPFGTKVAPRVREILFAD